MSLVADVEGLAAQLPALIAAHKAELGNKHDAMAVLKDAGLIYASEHWREGKYLYLIHPSRAGQRERRYVGADAGKIAAARASIRRGRQYDTLANEAAQVERKLRDGADRLRAAVALLAGTPAW